MERNTIAVLPHRYSVTRRGRLSSKLSSEAGKVTVLDTNKILAPVNIVKKTGLMESRTTLVALNVIQSVRRNVICPQTAYILSHAPFRDLTPIEFLLFNNNTTNWSVFQVPGVPQLSALLSEVPRRRPGNHLHLAVCAPEWVKAANKIPAVVRGSGRAPQITKIERSIATTFTKTVRVNITSCNKPFESSPKKRKEEHERGSDEPKGGNHQPTIVSSEHRLSLVNNRQFVDLDGEKEVPTRKRTGVKNYRHW